MYSIRLKTEERKNIRKAYLLIAITFVLLFFIANYGLKLATKFSDFLLEIKKGSEPVEISDTTPPPPPTFESLPSTTNQDTIEVKGLTEAGSTVSIVFKGKKEEIIANNEGKFLLTLKLSEGINRITATSTDKSGNVSQKTEVEITLDKTPPSLDITKPQDKSEFFGSRQRQVIIEGKTEENAKVQINDRWVVVERDGSFSFVTTLSEGENKFLIKAEDEAGNKTEKTITLSYSP